MTTLQIIGASIYACLLLALMFMAMLPLGVKGSIQCFFTVIVICALVVFSALLMSGAIQ